MSLDQVSPMQKQSAVMIGNESLLVECAKLWVGSGHEIATIITRNSDIANWAKSEGHAVTLHDGALKDVALPDGFDWLLSIANLQIIPADHLAKAAKGAVNFHDGPLPAYAGLNAPVWARMNGETEHGISWHLIEGDVDEGDLLVQRHFPVTEKDTALTLNTKCFAAAIESFPEVISALTAAQLPRVAQDLAKRSYFGLSDRPAAGGWLDFSKSAAELISLVRALDHGGYFNPLCAPKIAVCEGLLLLAEISAAEGHGEPGEVLAVEETGLTVACVDGAVTLSGFTDLHGQPVDPSGFVKAGEALAKTERAELINGALKQVARHEPYWRAALARFHPLDLPLVGAANAPAKIAFQPLKVPTQTEMKHVVAAAALLALRSGGDEGAGIAYRHSAQTASPSDLAEWVPLSLAPVLEDTVADYLGAAEALLDEIEAKDTFARDLVARAPDIEGLNTPDLAVVAGAGAAPVPTAAINILLSENGAQLGFDETRVSEEHAELLAARFELIIAGICNEDGRVGDIAALPDAEREKLLNGWIGAAVDIDPTATIHTEFAKQAAATPDATALVFEHASLTYAELDARSNQCAQVLKARGVLTGDVVGVHCRRSLDLVVACLAAMKAGAAYLPLDPGFPADRIAIYLEDSAARFVISQSAIASDLPETGADILLIDADKSIAAASQEAPDAETSGSDLAYLIFTSGSTGRPKGVMVEHTNVVNFFAGMDDRVKTDGPATWLAVTSLSFDISVLELFYTLTRGHKVVISGDESATQISDEPVGRDGQGMEFSLYYWGNDDGAGRGKYRLLLEGAKFADDNGFCAVWTPERHFHAFGGPYPNPSVTGAAVAGFTNNIGVRAGSCVAPLHHTARIAEEWAVIDNLTGGKAGLAIASGWQPDDFVLRPENTPPNNKVAMFEQIADLRKLWRGEAVAFPRADGTTFEALTQPRPVSAQPDIWVTTAGNPETWKEAGRNGAHILTHLLGQSIDEVCDKIKLYHAELRAAGHNPEDFKVTLMLHTFVGDDREAVRETAREPMKNYLRSAAGLIKQYAWAFPAFKKPEGVSNPFELDLGSLNEDEMEGILEFAFLRYFEDSGLFGTVDDCVERVETLQKIGVTEVACLIDYGIDTDVVLEGLRPLAQVVKTFEGGVAVSKGDVSIAGQIIRHDVTHLQCTPSMARLLTMNDEASTALSRVKHMFLGGEALPGALVGQLNTLSDATITNMYGPTETTIWSSTAGTSSDETTANIGQPIANTTLYVVDEDLQPVPFGVPGELLIGGTGVTRGYWNREDLTADRFVPDHFSGEGRLYRTGDLVQRRLDGALDFIGRADHQVKLRGYRIELGEIENRLEALSSVNEVVVITREDVPGDVRLVAYTTGIATEREMREELNLHVPSYMVPSHFVRLDALPLTPNKKIDRKALPAPAKKAATVAVALEPTVEAPTGDTTDVMPQIADLWSRILGVDGISASDNFFDLGGHSLLAVQAHREIRDSLGFKGVSITDIFRFPTLAGLAGRVAALAGPRVAKATPVAAPRAKPAAEAVETTPAATGRQDAMAKRRAMRARRREKQS